MRVCTPSEGTAPSRCGRGVRGHASRGVGVCVRSVRRSYQFARRAWRWPAWLPKVSYVYRAHSRRLPEARVAISHARRRSALPLARALRAGGTRRRRRPRQATTTRTGARARASAAWAAAIALRRGGRPVLSRPASVTLAVPTLSITLRPCAVAVMRPARGTVGRHAVRVPALRRSATVHAVGWHATVWHAGIHVRRARICARVAPLIAAQVCARVALAVAVHDSPLPPTAMHAVPAVATVPSMPVLWPRCTAH